MNSKIKFVIGIVLIMGVVVLVGTGCIKKEVTAPAEEEEAVVPEEEAAVVSEAEEKTPIEVAFEKAKDVEMSGAKAKAVDKVLRPVLKSVFDTVVDEEIISGVKMREEFGTMLTYAFNREVTEIERDAIISGLEAAGVNTNDPTKTEKVITVQKDHQMWVITFYLNNEQKSGLEITF